MAKRITLRDCRPGLFKFGRTLCFKSEYGDNNGRIDAYIVSTGEFFWGGAKTPLEQSQLLVTPVDSASTRISAAQRRVVEAAVKWRKCKLVNAASALSEIYDAAEALLKLERAKGDRK